MSQMLRGLGQARKEHQAHLTALLFGVVLSLLFRFFSTLLPFLLSFHGPLDNPQMLLLSKPHSTIQALNDLISSGREQKAWNNSMNSPTSTPFGSHKA